VDRIRRLRAHRGHRGAADRLAAEDEVRAAYRQLLGRDADPAGLAAHTDQLLHGGTVDGLRQALTSSQEYRSGHRGPLALEAMHRARQLWIRSLPAADRILDLGGSSTTSEAGALVEMGYQHDFEELLIVDLPQDIRHDLYMTRATPEAMRCGSGTVSFLYRSMADLGDLVEGSFDLVLSGQSFEHVTRDEGEQVLSEVHRVLSPGGILALDTPNRTLTELQLRGTSQEFINPDHKVEYHHDEMVQLFEQHGFELVKKVGLNGMPSSKAGGMFDIEELISSEPVCDDIESAYMLAYLARRA
jgi:predicted SAM-dependent methyltransferase